jgi:Zn-dependent protease with chaperone function
MEDPNQPAPNQSGLSLDSGADNQTRAVLSAALILGLLSTLGLEIRSLVLYGHFWLPLVLCVGYFFVVGIIAAVITASRSQGIKLEFDGSKRYVKFRRANESVQDKVLKIAKEMGFNSNLKIFTIPHTNSHIDGFAVSDFDEAFIVLTGGASLLSSRKDEDSVKLFNFLIRHEVAHIQRNDPMIFAFISAIIRLALFAVGFKLVITLLFGFEWVASWYGYALPRSFTISPEMGSLNIVQLPAYVVCFIVIGINFGLILMMAVLYWLWVRKREYWADFIAVNSYSTISNDRTILKKFFSSQGLKRFLPHGAKGSLWWHPSLRSREKAVDAKLPRGGFYSASGAVLIVVTIFIVRYVFGNNSGYTTTDYPQNLYVSILSIAYFCVSFYLIYCLVLPVRAVSGRQSLRWTYVKSWLWVSLIILMVTYAVQSLDFEWTIKSSSITGQQVSQNYLMMIATEGASRMLMFYGLGLSLGVFALTAVIQGVLFPRVWKMLGAVASFLILFVLTAMRIDGIDEMYSKVNMKPPFSLTNLPKQKTAQTCGLEERYMIGPARGMLDTTLYLDRRLYPPIGVFKLKATPFSATTWNDERLTGVPAHLRDEIKAWYAEAQKKNDALDFDLYTLIENVKKILSVRRLSYEEQLPVIKAIREGKELQPEQQEALNYGLIKCAQEREPGCITIALALGANPKFVRTVNGEKYSLIETAYGMPLGSLDQCEFVSLKILLENGADANSSYVLIHATKNNDYETVRLLLEHGADPNAVFKDQIQHSTFSDYIPKRIFTTPLIEMVDNERTNSKEIFDKMFDLLIKSGANVNLSPDSGVTPLMIASSNCAKNYVSNSNIFPYIVTRLLENEADPSAVDEKGKSAVDYAMETEQKYKKMIIYKEYKNQIADCKNVETMLRATK